MAAPELDRDQRGRASSWRLMGSTLLSFFFILIILYILCEEGHVAARLMIGGGHLLAGNTW
jgi:hypothetical protein